MLYIFCKIGGESLNNFYKNIAIYIPSIILFSLLVFLFYIHTNIGFSETINGYEPFYAPAWVEAMVTTLFVPFMIGYSIKDHFDSKNI